jgi:hypothetical protein
MAGAFRFQPKIGAEHYQTWKITAPIATHTRPATCEEVDCEPHRNGWVTVVPAGSDLEDLVRRSGRAFTEERRDGGLIAFTFHAGQPCFQAGEHRVPLDRPALFLVRDGDWRGNPRGTPVRRYDKPYQWVDDMAGHLDRLHDLRG